LNFYNAHKKFIWFYAQFFYKKLIRNLVIKFQISDIKAKFIWISKSKQFAIFRDFKVLLKFQLLQILIKMIVNLCSIFFLTSLINNNTTYEEPWNTFLNFWPSKHLFFDDNWKKILKFLMPKKYNISKKSKYFEHFIMYEKWSFKHLVKIWSS